MMGTPRKDEAHEDGLGPLSIREVVESALEQEDIMPVVRLVFDAPSTPALPSGREEDALEEEDDEAEEDGGGDGGNAQNGGSRGRSEARGGRGGGGRAAAVLAMLQQVSEEQVQEISQVCRSNTDEIAGSMQELEAMQASVEELREQLGEAQSGLQGSGEGLLKILEMLQEASHVLAAIRESRKAVAVAIRLLQMVAAAGHFLQENRLYKSFRLLQRVRESLPKSSTDDDSKSGPALSSARGSITRTMSSKADAAAAAAAAAAAPSERKSSAGPQLGNLRKVLLERVDMLTKALEQKAVTDFNDWLVSVRAEARVVGMRVLCRAAAERAREEAAARQRRALHAQLPAIADVSRPAAAPAAESGGLGEVQHLDPKANPAAAEILANPPPDSGSEVLGSINMTLLLRCVQVHGCLGRLGAFQESYQRNRRLQLNSDLAPPANFAEGYRPFIAQLTGFFIIEDRVQRRCQPLCAGAQADAGWETAVAVLKTVLNIAFDTTATAASMLHMKDFVLLVCSALGNCGYHVVPVQEILMSGRAKYQELLCSALAAQLAAQVAQPTSPAALALWAQESPLLPSEVPDEATAAALRALGLPLSLNMSADPPLPPFAAPFSGVVPFLLRLFRGFVEDCVAYLTGLVSSAEVLPVVRQQRDKMLARVAIGALQASLDALSMRDLGRAMQAVTDAWALGAAMPTLDEFTYLRVRGGEMRERLGSRSPRKEQRGAFQISTASTSSGAASLQAQWAALQEAAERVVVRVLAAQSSSFLSQARAAVWLPELPPKAAAGASPYINEILDFLTDSLNLGARMLPREPHHAIARAAFTFLGDAIMDLLTEDAIPAYNMYALQQLSKDVSKLKAFAEASDVPDMAEGLAEPEQFCRLMTANALEEVLDAKQRAGQLHCLNLKRLCTVLNKYREIGDKASYTGSHSVIRSKQPESILKRKQVDKVIKALRGIHAGE